MTARRFLGVRLERIAGKWYHAGREIPNPLEHTIPCEACGLPPVDGCDGCIGRLPGVLFACCGHGKRQGYVMFSNGLVLRGRFEHEPPLKPPK